MNKDPRSIIIRPIITEHSYDVMENNVYTFEVARDANKIEIKNVKPKPKRVRYQKGYTRHWKKAMVTLSEGDSIEIFAS